MPSKTARQNSKANAKRSKISDTGSISPANATAAAAPTAEDKLWSVLRENPGSTTAELADKAEIGKSTAARFLAKWATDGSATRTTGTGPRGADTWTLPADVPPVNTPAEESAPDVETVEPASTLDDTVPSDDAPGPVVEPDEATTASASRRLPPGGLHGIVEDYLRAHPDEEFGPGAIARTLDRSSGAVSNALDRMIASGLAVQTSSKPKRFQLAPAERSGAKK